MILDYPFQRVVTSLRGSTKGLCSGMLILRVRQDVQVLTTGKNGHTSPKNSLTYFQVKDALLSISDVSLSLLPYRATNDNSGLVTQVHWVRTKDSWEVECLVE